MPNKNKEKGNALEKAVKLIQEAILKSDPKFAGTNFSIETNKIETVSGVRHEIDVFVKTLKDSPYESSWIFECKNWDKPVGKNEVIVLAEKVNALGASRGFLVARNLTKDAKARIKLDRRLKFIPCTDEFLNPTFNIELTHTEHHLYSIKALLKEHGVPSIDLPKGLEWKGKVCLLNNKPVDFERFLNDQCDQLISKDQKESSGRYLLESTHHGKSEGLIKFNHGEFLIGDFDVEHIILTVQFWVTVHKRRLISKFELIDQGRVFSFEPIEDVSSGQKLEIDIVQMVT